MAKQITVKRAALSMTVERKGIFTFIAVSMQTVRFVEIPVDLQKFTE